MNCSPNNSFQSISISRRRCGQVVLKLVVVVCLLALAGMAYALFTRQAQHQSELASLQSQNEQLQEANAAFEKSRNATTTTQISADERLELVKLRGEVATLRPLQKQYQQAQAEVQQLRGTIQQLQQATAESANLRNQNQQLQDALQARTHIEACINNLRAIAGAKANWAAQHQKAPGDVPMDSDLFGPGRPLPEKPACPAGGVYAVGPVQGRPVCNVPGHAF